MRALLIDTIREACVNETISAAQCEAAGSAASESVIRDTLMTIAHDEQEHSALAWATVKWILSVRPDLKAEAEAVFEDALSHDYATGPLRDDELSKWGVLSTQAEMAVAKRTIRRVIRPCMNALFGESRHVAAAAE